MMRAQRSAFLGALLAIFAWTFLPAAFGVVGDITTIAGTGTAGYSGDGGPAISATLSAPQGVALGGNGDLFIADYENHRVRRVDATTGTITTVAGTGTAGYSGDEARRPRQC